MTGATLPQDSSFASKVSKEAAVEVGRALGSRSKDLGISLMVSGSMYGHGQAISIDTELTRGFCSHESLDAVHFKGTNTIRLHGDLWRIAHGISYVLEEADADFSNHTKEACIMACASNELSIALCCNGGPTVACNVLRFLGLCSPRRVFSLCGMHGPSGKSGAGPMPFALTEAQTVSFFNTLVELAPAFFERLVKERLERIDAANIQALLE